MFSALQARRQHTLQIGVLTSVWGIFTRIMTFTISESDHFILNIYTILYYTSLGLIINLQNKK